MRTTIVNANLASKHFAVGRVNVVIPMFQLTKLSCSNVDILQYCKKWLLALLGLSRISLCILVFKSSAVTRSDEELWVAERNGSPR